MDSTIFNKWISSSYQFQEHSLLEIEELVELYPYSQSLRIVYLTALSQLNKLNFTSELKKAALYIPDRKILFNLLEKNTETLSDILDEVSNDSKSEEKEHDRTLSVIDSFLSTLPEENVDFTGLEVSSDYMGYLFEDEVVSDCDTKPLEGQHLIDNFLNKPLIKKELPTNDSHEDEEAYEKVVVEPTVVAKELESEDEGLFTETLAKIYIKQKRYAKAHEILKKISLKYQNKNAYFVDQIRFLEKLINNAKSK